MLNTGYLCQPVIETLAEHDRIAQEKAKRPIIQCLGCHDCSNPILTGSNNGNHGCRKIVDTIIFDWVEEIVRKNKKI